MNFGFGDNRSGLSVIDGRSSKNSLDRACLDSGIRENMEAEQNLVDGVERNNGSGGSVKTEDNSWQGNAVATKENGAVGERSREDAATRDKGLGGGKEVAGQVKQIFATAGTADGTVKEGGNHQTHEGKKSDKDNIEAKDADECEANAAKEDANHQIGEAKSFDHGNDKVEKSHEALDDEVNENLSIFQTKDDEEVDPFDKKGAAVETGSEVEGNTVNGDLPSDFNKPEESTKAKGKDSSADSELHRRDTAGNLDAKNLTTANKSVTLEVTESTMTEDMVRRSFCNTSNK